MDTLLRLFSALGLEVPGGRIWTGSATTDVNGDWSIDYTAAHFTEAPFVVAMPIQDTATPADMCWSALRSRSSTAAAGTVLRGVTLLGALVSVRRGPAGVDVMVMAIGASSG